MYNLSSNKIRQKGIPKTYVDFWEVCHYFYPPPLEIYFQIFRVTPKIWGIDNHGSFHIIYLRFVKGSTTLLNMGIKPSIWG